MRLAVGQLWQETNTLNPIVTTRADFEQFGICRGSDLVARMANVNELGGFIQSLREWPERPEIVGLVRLPAWPGGKATRETFEWIREQWLSAIGAALPVEGLLLALHGALVADDHPDVEGELLAETRRLVGHAVPIVCTLDLHANVTTQMVEAVDVLLTYHCMPHVDIHETGVRAAAVLRKVMCENAQPVTAFAKIPAVVPPEHSNTEAAAGVAMELKRKLRELESSPRVLSAGLAPVQPWLDITQLGSSVLVTTDNDRRAARDACAQIANEFWRRKEEYLPRLHAINDAVAQAHQNAGLTVLSDAADATTSGAPGDSVWILQELLKYSWRPEALVTVVSPEVVLQCQRAGSGAKVHVELGGLRDTRFGTRIALEALVVRCFDARFVMTGHIGRNMPIDMGLSAVLRHARNVCMVVTSRSGPHFAPELFRAAGQEPFQAAVVVAKSPCGFRAAYEREASAILSVKAPGCAPSDFWNHEFQSIPRPLWPWDQIESWSAAPEIVVSQRRRHG